MFLKGASSKKAEQRLSAPPAFFFPLQREARWVHRALRSLLYHWKKNVCALCAYTVLFALCFGSIVLFSSVWGQREFLRASLERSVTLRAASYRIRVNETQAGVLSFPLDLHAVEAFRGDPAVEGWNACLQGAVRLEGTVLPYQKEREASWEAHRAGQTGMAGRDGLPAIFVEDSRRSFAFLLCGLELVEGQHFSGEDPGRVCLVSQEFAQLNNLSVGDTLAAVNPSESLVSADPYRVEVTISGIFSCPDSQRPKGIGARGEEMVLFPLSLYSQMGGGDPDSSMKYVTVYLREGESLQDFVSRIQETLAIQSVLDSHYTQGTEIPPPEELAGLNYDQLVASLLEADPSYILQLDREWYDMVSGPVDQQVRLAAAMTGLLLASVVLILSLATVLSMKSRRREIGILLSMGETRGGVLGQLLLELLAPVAAALVLGTLAGVWAGVPLAEGLSNGVYAEQAAETEKDNQTVTFGSLLATTDPFEIQEGKLSMDLADGGVTDVTAYPPAESRVSPLAILLYGGAVLVSAALAALLQGFSVTRANPAAILLGRR